MIYKNFFYNLRHLKDICTLFYDDYPSLVTKMVGNVIKQVEGICDDYLIQCRRDVDFNVWDTKCSILTGISKSRQSAEGDHQLVKIVLKLTDNVRTMAIFFKAYPPAAKVLHQSRVRVNMESMYYEENEFSLFGSQFALLYEVAVIPCYLSLIHI